MRTQSEFRSEISRVTADNTRLENEITAKKAEAEKINSSPKMVQVHALREQVASARTQSDFAARNEKLLRDLAERGGLSLT